MEGVVQLAVGVPPIRLMRASTSARSPVRSRRRGKSRSAAAWPSPAPELPATYLVSSQSICGPGRPPGAQDQAIGASLIGSVIRCSPDGARRARVEPQQSRRRQDGRSTIGAALAAPLRACSAGWWASRLILGVPTGRCRLQRRVQYRGRGRASCWRRPVHPSPCRASGPASWRNRRCGSAGRGCTRAPENLAGSPLVR